MNGFRAPGRLRLLARWVGDLVYGVLISFGRQPRDQRDEGKQ